MLGSQQPGDSAFCWLRCCRRLAGPPGPGCQQQRPAPESSRPSCSSPRSACGGKFIFAGPRIATASEPTRQEQQRHPRPPARGPPGARAPVRTGLGPSTQPPCRSRTARRSRRRVARGSGRSRRRRRRRARGARAPTKPPGRPRRRPAAPRPAAPPLHFMMNDDDDDDDDGGEDGDAHWKTKQSSEN